MFDKNVFDAAFAIALEVLAGAERITKETLKDLSRTVLEAHHQTEDIGYVNRLVSVLTPVNREACILYFKTFSGFNWNDGEAEFGKKDKKHYEAAKSKSLEFLEDPHNNLWTWYAMNVKPMETKKLDLSKITQYFKGALKKAADEGIPQSAVVKAVFDAGVDVDSILVLLGEMPGIELAVKDNQDEEANAE